MFGERPFGEVFRERRIALGLTQLEVAQRLGVSQAAVSEFERQRDHGCHLATLERYASALGTTMTELFGSAE